MNTSNYSSIEFIVGPTRLFPKNISTRYLWAGFVFFFLLLGSLIISSPALAINVSGAITTNTQWIIDNSPYVLIGTVTVAQDVTLTIDPGVIVKFSGGTTILQVNGTLNAEGTSGAPIFYLS